MNTMQFMIGTPPVPCPEPDNWSDLELELSMENPGPEATLNATKLTWKGANAVFLNKWKASNPGIFEGPTLVITACGNEVIFYGTVDLTDPETVWNCDIVTARIRDHRMDLVTQLLDSLSWAGLLALGAITPADYIWILSQVNTQEDAIEFMTTINAIVSMIHQIEKIIQEVVGLLTGATAAGTFLGLGGVAAEIVNFIFWMFEIAVTLAVTIDLIESAFTELIEPIYVKFGTNVMNLMTKALKYWGIGFQSTLLSNPALSGLTWMPVKQAWAAQASTNFVSTVFSAFVGGGFSAKNRQMYDDPTNLFSNGFAYGYPDGTIGDFFRVQEDTFNAKCKIILNSSGNPVLNFERWDYVYKQSSYTLPDISDQAPFEQSYKTNAAALSANYYIHSALDSNDLNTMDFYDGIACYAQTVPTKIVNPFNVVLQGLTEKALPWAQGKRKEHLTMSEQLLQDIFVVCGGIVNGILNYVVNPFLSGIGWVLSIIGVSSPSPIPLLNTTPYNGTLGVLQISQNTTTVPKMLLVDNTGRLNPNNHTPTDPLACRNLMKYYHFSNLAISVAPGPPYTTVPAGTLVYNQWYIYDGQKIPLCCSDYKLIYNNNIIYTFTKQQARMDSLKWKSAKDNAIIDYRVNVLYAPNLYVVYIVDNAIYTLTL